MDYAPHTLADTLRELLPGFPDASLAVALSGGADSAALLHALARLRDAHPALRLRALHVDHGLQAAAAPLRAAAQACAGRCAVPFDVLAVRVDDAAQDGVEAAARRARYGALATALADGEALLTAHHREDQAETLLLQLLRGAGLRGLAAMPASAALGRGLLLRPLLGVARAELVAYARAAGLEWCEDPMNADPRYDRAYLRAAVWPALVARWPAAGETLARAARHAAVAQSLLDDQAQADLAQAARGAALSIPALLALSAARRGELLRYWLAAEGVRAPPAARLALIDRELLASRGANGPRMRWADVELRRYADELHLVRELPRLPARGELHPDRPLTLAGLGALSAHAAIGSGLAAEGLAWPLVARARAGGERLRLAPHAPRRELKDLLREARVPPWVRERLPLLWAGDRLVAVAHPGGAWIACEAAARPGRPSFELAWTGAPAALRSAGAWRQVVRGAAFIERPP